MTQAGDRVRPEQIQETALWTPCVTRNVEQATFECPHRAIDWADVEGRFMRWVSSHAHGVKARTNTSPFSAFGTRRAPSASRACHAYLNGKLSSAVPPVSCKVSGGVPGRRAAPVWSG